MGLLVAEAAKLALPRLKMEILETQIIRGAPELFARIPFRVDEAEDIKLLWEGNQAPSSSLAHPGQDSELADPTTSTTASDGRTIVEQTLNWRHMRRHADVLVINTFDRRFFDKKREEIGKQAKYITEDWADQLVNGFSNTALTFAGMEFFLDYMTTTLGRAELSRYNTDDDLSSGTAQALSLTAINRTRKTMRCGTFAFVIVDLDTFIEFNALLEAKGGNTAPMLMAESFGVPIMSDGQYNGLPIIVYDEVGRAKASTQGDSTNADATLNVLAADDKWIGWTSLDVGRRIIVTDGLSGPVIHDANILSVTDADTVELDANNTNTVSPTPIAMEAVSVMYFVNPDESDGFHYRHPEQNGSLPRTVGKCLPSVGGFTEINIGLLQGSEIERTRLRGYGNFANEGIDSLARLSHYTLPS